MPHWHFSKPRIPFRALAIAVAALAVPFIDTAFAQQETDPTSALLWLLALVPAFLLAFYRGWRGVATALAAGMAALSLAVSVMVYRGALPRQDLLLPVVAAYIAIALAIGFMSEKMHDARASAEGQALTDDLTGLANRRHGRMHLEAKLADAARGAPVSVVLFDVDNFKIYNDHNGHAAGDVMLREFAEVLRREAGAQHLPVRYGGEEFLTVLSACDQSGALAFAERVRRGLKGLNGGQGGITVSAGIATYGPGLTAANELLICADRALYQAKQDGRDRVCVAPVAELRRG